MEYIVSIAAFAACLGALVRSNAAGRRNEREGVWLAGAGVCCAVGWLAVVMAMGAP